MTTIPETQTAIQATAFGPDFEKNIHAVQVPVPSPGPAEVLVRISARPLNPADVFAALGVYPGFKPKQMPAVLGLEGVGTVAKLGAGCSGRLAEGQRVVATLWRSSMDGNGTWQQYLVAAEEDLVAVPDDLPDEAACQALINPVPVVGMFQELATPKGEYVIVTAAGSALGRMALAYARRELGVRTLATCRRAEQVEELKLAGADEVVVVAGPEDGPKLHARAAELTGGKGAWGALECVAGDMPLLIAPAVREGGSIIVYGAMSSVDIKWSFVEAAFRGVALKGFWLVPWMLAKPAEERRAVLEVILRHMCSGLLPAHTADVRPLEDAVAALRDQGEVGRPSKIVLRG